MQKYLKPILPIMILSSFFLFTNISQIHATARAPSISEMSRVQSLAEQLKIDTDDAYVEAAKDAGTSQGEEIALHNLYDLKQNAASFYDQVSQNINFPANTVDGFYSLNKIFSTSRDSFDKLTAYQKAKPMFETIVDSVGNLRQYYVAKGDYTAFPDYKVYPYYPGYTGYVYAATPAVPYYYRYPYYSHENPYYYNYYPYRTNYHWGYGAYPYHYSYYGRHYWY